MKKHRQKSKNDLKSLTNGPSKLCMAFDITKNEFKSLIYKDK